jgi:hypothetical protein
MWGGEVLDEEVGYRSGSSLVAGHRVGDQFEEGAMTSDNTPGAVAPRPPRCSSPAVGLGPGDGGRDKALQRRTGAGSVRILRSGVDLACAAHPGDAANATVDCCVITGGTWSANDYRLGGYCI